MSLHVTGAGVHWSRVTPPLPPCPGCAVLHTHRGLQPPPAPGHCNKASHWSSHQPLGPGRPMGWLVLACVAGPGIDLPWCGCWCRAQSCSPVLPGARLQDAWCFLIRDASFSLHWTLHPPAPGPSILLTLGLLDQKSLSTALCPFSKYFDFWFRKLSHVETVLFWRLHGWGLVTGLQAAVSATVQ